MKKTIRAEVNNFVKGLITEASPLNYPPNASIIEKNFELNRDGTRDRRLGLDYEPSFTRHPTNLLTSELSTFKVNTFKWVGVNGSPETDFLVVQLETVLQFYNLSSEPLSTSGYVGSITLTSFPVSTNYSFSSIEGTLVVVAGADTIASVSYDGSVFTAEYSPIRVRDQWGVEVTGIPSYETDPSFRGGFDANHSYNLQNQSWGIPRKNNAGTLVDPSPTYFIDLGVYPSNSEVVWTGMQFQPVTAGVTFERLYTNLFTELKGASVKAAKGYFIIDLLNRGVSRKQVFEANAAAYPAMSISTINLPQDASTGGATVVTEFAGRVWYSGFSGEVIGGDGRSPNLSNFLLFSQIVRNKNDITKCYQDGDPSSRESSDIVESDGGYIRISGAKNIVGARNLDSALIVFADNGVWSITGGGDYGFTATTYKVSKLSSFGAISNSSIVVEGGRAFFWSDDGIYVVAKNDLGNLGVQSISEATIQTYYEQIPNTSKEACTGVYDPNAKKIRWFYNSGDRFSNTSAPKELILDMVLNAFYVSEIQTLATNNVEVLNLFSSVPFKRGTGESDVYSETNNVLSSADSVVVNESIRSTGLQSIRYVTLEVLSGVVYLTFSYYYNSSFKDWFTVDGIGVDAKGVLLTGQEIAKDSAIDKQIPYLVMHFRRTENGVDSNLVPVNQSGCLVRSQWSFSNAITSNKWSSLKQAYRYRRARFVEDVSDTYDTGFELITTKNKIRGNGPAFSLYMETEPDKDCRIVGWSISLTGNQNA
jgi:hypothetical protein